MHYYYIKNKHVYLIYLIKFFIILNKMKIKYISKKKLKKKKKTLYIK